MKDEFLRIYQENVKRPGAEEFLKWLKSTDFFSAPASTRFHLARPGGLVEHSVHVHERLKALCKLEENLTPAHQEPTAETVAVCGLLHDICKVNFYGVEMRNRKNEQGKWEQCPFYIVNDQLPYGHGEKSVYIINGFLKLIRCLLET